MDDYKETRNGDKVIKKGSICAFYPRYVKKIKKENEFCLKEVCEINKHSKDEISKETINSLEYVEITNLKKNKITGKFKKINNSSRLARKGDILFASLPSSTWKEQIVIIDKDYKVSSAIYTLTFINNEKGENIRGYIYEYLSSNKNDILKDIKSLSDGFKVSKLKISEFNLMNNVYFAKG